ncbi:hypothetical protein BKI52_35945 [marine bacterium AO1-C]|nr:hypothetical protein BKI52_35945 [marine bacterium AO1-C]
MFFLKKAQSGKALVRQGAGGMKVSMDKMTVYPVLHQLEVVDLSLKSLTVELTEANAVLCKDYIKADIKAAVFIKVSNDPLDITTIAHVFDVHQLDNKEYLADYFLPQVAFAIRTVVSHFEYRQLYDEREQFVDHIIQTIGRDLSGFRLEDIAIDYLEQTSLDFYNEDDFLEQVGKGKVNRLTLENQLITAHDKLKLAEEVARVEQEANTVRYRLELETKKVELERRLEITRLAAEQEVTQDRASGKLSSLDTDIDQKIEAIRAKAQQERERLEQLLKEKEAKDKNSDND